MEILILIVFIIVYIILYKYTIGFKEPSDKEYICTLISFRYHKPRPYEELRIIFQNPKILVNPIEYVIYHKNSQVTEIYANLARNLRLTYGDNLTKYDFDVALKQLGHYKGTTVSITEIEQRYSYMD